MLRFLYQRLLKPILFRFEPEGVHDLFVRLGALLGAFAIGRWLVRLLYGYRGPSVAREVDGLTYRTPVLLAAGFDYNGELMGVLPSLAFGGQEVGSVTARPCAGNDPPRMRRLIRSRGLVVNKGLRNRGVDAIIGQLQGQLRRHGKPAGYVLGISIARTNDAIGAEVDAGIADYETSLRRLVAADIGDFYTINVSCPNVHGGESFAEPALLERLLARLDAVEHRRPVYVKLPINPPWPEIRALLEVIDRHRIAGVVIGNLNKDYSRIPVAEERPPAYIGGISGPTCGPLATALIRETRRAFGERFTIIACGGIQTAEDALERLDAGADLVQLITGMIFEGPHLIRAICRAVADREAASRQGTKSAAGGAPTRSARIADNAAA